MAKRAVLLGQNRAWRVIAHRGQCLFAILGHGREDLLQLFHTIPGRDLAAPQLVAPVHGRLVHTGEQFVGIVDLANPVAKRLRGGQFVLDLGIVVKLARFHIDRKQLSGTKRALFHHARFIDRHHARL